MTEEQKVPALRFPEFTEEWRSIPFEDMYEFKRTNSYSRDQLNYDDGLVFNIHYGDIHTKFDTLFEFEKSIVPYVNSDVDYSRYDEEDYLMEGDVVIADASEDYADIGKSIEVVNLGDKKVLAGLHTFLARRRGAEPVVGFSAHLLKSEKVRAAVRKIAQGTKVLGLSMKRVAKINLNIPSPPEQQKIATFLATVDERLRLLEAQREELQRYKQGVMQRIFNLELRFREENGEAFPEWEPTTLGDSATFSKGRGISKKDIEEGAILPCIRYGELYTTYGEVIDSVVGTTNLDAEKLVISEPGDVIIPASGETQIDIATASCVLRGGIALSGDLNIVRSNINGIFLAYYLGSAKKYEIARMAQGNSVVHLYGTQLKSLKIDLPISIEQEKISSFLVSIDKNIRLSELKRQELLQYKQGLLQNLFV